MGEDPFKHNSTLNMKNKAALERMESRDGATGGETQPSAPSGLPYSTQPPAVSSLPLPYALQPPSSSLLLCPILLSHQLHTVLPHFHHHPTHGPHLQQLLHLRM